MDWYGAFLIKWGYPKSILNRIVNYKPTILGYPHFRKPPYAHGILASVDLAMVERAIVIYRTQKWWFSIANS